MRRHLIQARFASVPSRPGRPCPKFRGSRSWLSVPRRASGVSWFLPRIRRSPCETDSASAAHGCQGHGGINGRGPRLRSAAKQAWEAVRLCRERPLQPSARRYGSQQRRPTNDGAQMTVRRGKFGPCAIARGPSHAPVRARWPATNFRWKSSLLPAQRLRRVQPSLRSIMGELCLPCACVPTGPQRAPAGRRHDRQSNDLSPDYWLFQRRRRKLSSDGRFPVSAQATRESSP